MQRLYSTLSILVLAALLSGCALRSNQIKSPEDYRMPTDVPAPPALTQTAESEISSKIPPADCPVTNTGILSFDAPAPYSASAPWEGEFWFGSDGLWTALHNDGVWAELPLNPDGYTQK